MSLLSLVVMAIVVSVEMVVLVSVMVVVVSVVSTVVVYVLVSSGVCPCLGVSCLSATRVSCHPCVSCVFPQITPSTRTDSGCHRGTHTLNI